jgi:hypothetical protein
MNCETQQTIRIQVSRVGERLTLGGGAATGVSSADSCCTVTALPFPAMSRRWIPGVIAAAALVGCGSQTTNAPPTAQPVALQSTTTVAKPKAKHVRKARVHKQTASTAPASTSAPTVQAPTATVAAAPPVTTAAPAPAQAPAPVAATTTPSQPTTAHKHKKKSTGTSAGGTGLNSQGY